MSVGLVDVLSGLKNWGLRTGRWLRKEGIRGGIWRSVYDINRRSWRLIDQFAPRGATNIFDRDWDLLIILDACRVDAMQAVADEYDFIDSVERVTSVGSQSEQWMANTFTEEHQSEWTDAAYISANPHTKEFDIWSELREFAPSWKTHHDNSAGVTPPRPVTDTAIQWGRDKSYNRCILHYMQPHHPFVRVDLHEEIRADVVGAKGELNENDALKEGVIDSELYWEGYIDNLRYVLDDVELLLRNFDAPKVVITADHGEALGEWGQYGHPVGFRHPSVATVPWVETTAVDEESHTPQEIYHREAEEYEVDEQLQSLGYR